MENIATAQPGQIAFFIIGCLVVAVAIIVWLMTGVRHDSEPVTLDPIVLAGQLWADILNWRPVNMSSSEHRENRSASDPVCIPVSHTSMDRSGMNADPSDIDAENDGMPRLSRDITEEAELVFLCVVRNKDGKYRHSANKIYELIGGDRNTVLAKIKEIRGTPPAAEYRQSDGSAAPASHPVTSRAA